MIGSHGAGSLDGQELADVGVERRQGACVHSWAVSAPRRRISARSRTNDVIILVCSASAYPFAQPRSMLKGC